MPTARDLGLLAAFSHALCLGPSGWKAAGIVGGEYRDFGISRDELAEPVLVADEPSTMSLLGLVRHLAKVERATFRATPKRLPEGISTPCDLAQRRGTTRYS